jgi:membrane protein DedA with SNARE-associated domain
VRTKFDIYVFIHSMCCFFLSTYSTEADASLSDGLSDSMKILIGALVGGVLLFVLVVILIACLLRRKKKKSSEQ